MAEAIDIPHLIRMERAFPQDALHIVDIQDLLAEQFIRHVCDQVLVLCHEVNCTLVRAVGELPNLLVDQLGGFIGVGLVKRLPVHAVGQQAHLLIHAIHSHLGVSHLCHPLQIIHCTRGDLAQQHLLSGPSAQGGTQPVQELLLRHQHVLIGQVLCKAQHIGATRHNGHLEQRLRVFQEPRHHCVPALVEGHCAALLRTDHLVLLLQSSDHTVNGLLKVGHVHSFLLKASCHQGPLIAHVGDISTAHARREGCQPL
mmetsp:Transcript_7855/g.13511  ORF Transcript_7855/g.13511 Transcript_7855/m.13511 type:complete len:256 (+) Transcript_7855:1165-1932(+)